MRRVGGIEGITFTAALGINFFFPFKGRWMG